MSVTITRMRRNTLRKCIAEQLDALIAFELAHRGEAWNRARGMLADARYHDRHQVMGGSVERAQWNFNRAQPHLLAANEYRAALTSGIAG